VLRTIYFYKVETGAGDSSKQFEYSKVLDAVDCLPYSGQHRDRYQAEEDGNEVWAWIDGSAKMRFGRTRHRGLPLIEKALKFTAIPIPSDAGISDEIHVVFFKDNVVGAEFNYLGPRMSRLAWYLREKCPDTCGQIRFDVLPRPEIQKQLDKLEGLRLFGMRVKPSYISIIRQADTDIAEMFKAQLALGDAKEFEVVIRAERNKSLNERLRKFIKKLLKRDDVAQGVSALEVSGRSEVTGKIEEIDLLRDQLISKKDIILENSATRALDKDSAYSAISKAYTELHNEISAASGISLT
jgi:hypothetical protein